MNRAEPPPPSREPPAPVQGAGDADVRRAAAGHRRPRSRRRTSPVARSTRASRGRDTGALTVIVIVFLAAAVINWAATYVQTFLINWVGQRALQDLRIEVFQHLQRLSVGFYSRNKAGRADLASDERRAGARPARHGGDLDAVLGDAHARRHRGDPGPARRGAGDDHVPDLPGRCSWRAWRSGSPRRAPTGSRARRSRRSRPTSRRHCPACAWCARSGRSRATAVASRS